MDNTVCLPCPQLWTQQIIHVRSNNVPLRGTSLQLPQGVLKICFYYLLKSAHHLFLCNWFFFFAPSPVFHSPTSTSYLFDPSFFLVYSSQSLDTLRSPNLSVYLDGFFFSPFNGVPTKKWVRRNTSFCQQENFAFLSGTSGLTEKLKTGPINLDFPKTKH